MRVQLVRGEDKEAIVAVIVAVVVAMVGEGLEAAMKGSRPGERSCAGFFIASFGMLLCWRLVRDVEVAVG